MTAKILILDIESSPHMAWVWKFWKENVAPKQVIESGVMLSYAAKWLGNKEIYYKDTRDGDERLMLQSLAELMDSADMVVAHNAIKFDIPMINARFVTYGIKPPSPYKIIDTLQIAKKEFRFPSNSLEYLSGALNLSVKKDEHKKFPGFLLWLGVMENNKEAWEEMERYNIDDILALEELYLRFRPFHRNHPNVSIYDEHIDSPSCPKCGGHDIQFRGYAHTQVGRFHRFQCNSCGGWGRTRHSILTKDERLNVVVNAVS